MHHHPSQNIGIINTLATGAWRVSDTDHIKGELEHIRTTLINNGYNGKEADKVFHNVKKRRHKTKERDTTLPRVTLPYIHGTTNKIANILKKKNIRVVFAPPNSVRTLLDKAKDPIDLKHHKGVYKTPCSCGEAYIGETGISIRQLVKRARYGSTT